MYLHKLVDGDNDLETKLLGVFNVLAQVGTTLLEQFQVFLLVDLGQGLSGRDGGTTTVHLQCSDSGDNDDGVGLQARNSALDVAELCEGSASIDVTITRDSLSIPISAPKPASVIT